jgi:hypothetical protein
MADVFISYARADRDRARLVAHGLTAEGFSVWWDPDIKPGKKWNDVIRRSLSDAAAVVGLWTPRSANSAWVLGEITDAHNRQVLAPAILKRCNPPIPFNMIQSADLTRWRGRGDDPDWVLLLERVRALVEAKKRMAPAVPPPGEAEAALGGGMGHIYQPAVGRGPFAPRLGQILLGGVVAAAVVAGGLMAAGALPPIWTPPATPLAEASRPEAATTTPVSSTAPAAEPAAPAAPPGPASPPQAGDPPAPGTSATSPSPPTVHDPRAEGTVDACVSRLVRFCSGAPGRTAVGVSADRSLSSQEQRFLGALGVTAYPTGAGTVAQCQALTGQLNTRSPTLVSACRGLQWDTGRPTRPPVGAPPSATNSGDEPGELNLPVDQTIDILRRNTVRPAPVACGPNYDIPCPD